MMNLEFKVLILNNFAGVKDNIQMYNKYTSCKQDLDTNDVFFLVVLLRTTFLLCIT